MVFSSIFTICKNRCILFFTLNSCHHCICNRWNLVYYSFNCSNKLWNGQFFSEKKKLYSKNIRDNFSFNWYTSNYRFLPKLLRYFFPFWQTIKAIIITAYSDIINTYLINYILNMINKYFNVVLQSIEMFCLNIFFQ